MITPQEKMEIFSLFLKAPTVDAPPRTDTPVIYVIAGGIGAGKTSFRKNLLAKGRLPEDAVLHDPDAVMQALPGYLKMLAETGDKASAFATWEMPARFLAEEILSAAVWSKRDVIYERTCAIDTAADFLKHVKKQGYRIEMHLVHSDLDTALARARRREEEEQRHTPPAVIRERYAALLRLWPQYRNIADRIALYDNTDTDTPFRPVFAAEGTEERIFAADLYALFTGGDKAA